MNRQELNKYITVENDDYEENLQTLTDLKELVKTTLEFNLNDAGKAELNTILDELNNTTVPEYKSLLNEDEITEVLNNFTKIYADLEIVRNFI